MKGCGRTPSWLEWQGVFLAAPADFEKIRAGITTLEVQKSYTRSWYPSHYKSHDEDSWKPNLKHLRILLAHLPTCDKFEINKLAHGLAWLEVNRIATRENQDKVIEIFSKWDDMNSVHFHKGVPNQFCQIIFTTMHKFLVEKINLEATQKTKFTCK